MPHAYEALGQPVSSAGGDTASATSNDGHDEEEQAFLADPRVSTDSVRNLFDRDPLLDSAISNEPGTGMLTANSLPVTLAENHQTRLAEMLVMVQAGTANGIPVEMVTFDSRNTDRGALTTSTAVTSQQVATVSAQPERASVPSDQTDSTAIRDLIARERASAYTQGRSDANCAEPSMCVAGCACGCFLGCLGSAWLL